MDREKFKKNHPVLEKIVSGFVLIPEVIIWQISDFLTIPPRNWVFPVALKKRVSWLSCRDYYSVGYEEAPACKPVKKYYHEWAFLFKYVCRSYDKDKKRCVKYKKNNS